MSTARKMEKVPSNKNRRLVCIAVIAASICAMSAMDSVFDDETAIAQSDTIWMYNDHVSKQIQNTSQLTNLSFEIVTDKSVLKSGETLNISIRVTNTGWENVTLSWPYGGPTDQSETDHPNFSNMGFVVEGSMGRVAGGVRDSMFPAISWVVFEPNQTNYFNYTWDQSIYRNVTTGLTTGNYTIKVVVNHLEGTVAQKIIYIEAGMSDIAILLVIAVSATITLIVSFSIIGFKRKKIKWS
jgi:hypothetical protein